MYIPALNYINVCNLITSSIQCLWWPTI